MQRPRSLVRLSGRNKCTFREDNIDHLGMKIGVRKIFNSKRNVEKTIERDSKRIYPVFHHHPATPPLLLLRERFVERNKVKEPDHECHSREKNGAAKKSRVFRTRRGPPTLSFFSLAWRLPNKGDQRAAFYTTLDLSQFSAPGFSTFAATYFWATGAKHGGERV